MDQGRLTKSYTVASPVGYRYIRLNISRTGNYGYTALGEFQLYGIVGIVDKTLVYIVNQMLANQNYLPNQ